jgi:para-nitrobenzyl esterase
MIGATSADSGGITGPMIAGGRALAGQLAGHGAAVYKYRFSYVAESIAKPGAPHASDVPFFFGTQRARCGAATTSRDDGMGQAISSYVANFAKTGDPNDGVHPAWPRYDRAQDVLMNW